MKKNLVTKLKINRVEKYKKTLSISISFFIYQKNLILNIFKNLYIEKELINVY